MPVILSPLLISAIAVLSAAAGVWLSGIRPLARRVLSFSGGVLVGVAAFWVLPEMAVFFRWTGAAAWLAGGFALLWIIDRWVYPVCPACSHTHDHDVCATRLHGFATPLLAAAALHSALDGWSLGASRTEAFGPALVAALALHKIPEGLALGVLARAAMRTGGKAIAGCAAAQAATILGAWLAAISAPHLGAGWIHALLALAGGSFLYLGWHAVHGEVRRRGVPAVMPALTGVAGTSVIRMLAR